MIFRRLPSPRRGRSSGPSSPEPSPLSPKSQSSKSSRPFLARPGGAREGDGKGRLKSGRVHGRLLVSCCRCCFFWLLFIFLFFSLADRNQNLYRPGHMGCFPGSNIQLSGSLSLQRSPNSVIIAQVPLTLAMPLRTSECGGWRQELVGLELGWEERRATRTHRVFETGRWWWLWCLVLGELDR